MSSLVLAVGKDMRSLGAFAFALSSVLVPATAAVTCSGDLQTVEKQEQGPVDRQTRLLQLALEHTEEGKLSLEKERTAASAEPIRKLAELLLDEWKLSPSDPKLRTPVLVWRPKLNLKDLPPEAREISSPSVLISGEVAPEGFFSDPHLLVSSGNKILDDICLDAAKQALYRPARSEQDYIRTKAVLQFHFDPR